MKPDQELIQETSLPGLDLDLLSFLPLTFNCPAHNIMSGSSRPDPNKQMQHSRKQMSRRCASSLTLSSFMTWYSKEVACYQVLCEFDSGRRRIVIISTRIKLIRPARSVFRFTHFLPEGN